jgi:hypothetical protein
MDHHHILLCPFVRGFTALLVVGGLGVDDIHGLREVFILFIVISFWGLGLETRTAVENEEYTMNWNKMFYTLFEAVPDCTSKDSS